MVVSQRSAVSTGDTTDARLVQPHRADTHLGAGIPGGLAVSARLAALAVLLSSLENFVVVDRLESSNLAGGDNSVKIRYGASGSEERGECKDGRDSNGDDGKRRTHIVLGERMWVRVSECR